MMTEEERAQESKQRGAEAAKIKDPAARRAYIAKQGNLEAWRRSGHPWGQPMTSRDVMPFGERGSPEWAVKRVVSRLRRRKPSR